MMRDIYMLLIAMGIDLPKFLRFWSGLPIYIANAIRFTKMQDTSVMKIRKYTPYCADRFERSANIDRHYFAQDLLVAHMIYKARPKRHIDVGSRIDGLVAHVATFMPVEVMDIRPASCTIDGITYEKVDITERVPAHKCTSSLSCLHALEHIGLGRYGDKLSPHGYFYAFRNMADMLKLGGTMYLSVPVGEPRIEFDGLRVFGVEHLLFLVNRYFKVKSFNLINDKGVLIKPYLTEKSIKSNFGCYYGCGILELTKVKDKP